jgi:hypothetical protein
MAQAVRISGQGGPAKALGGFEHLVGVNRQRELGEVAGQRQCLAAVVAEIAPRPLDHGPGQIGQMRANDLLSAVGRAGIDDQVSTDVRPHRTEAAPDHVRLVLDDHVQAHAPRHRASLR